MKTRHAIIALLLLLFLSTSSLYAQDNAAFSWGRNVFGQLGDGTVTDRYSPVHIGTAADWASICGGGRHTLAIKNDGTLWAWGYNLQGQLGDGTHERRTSPVQIGTEVNWAAVSCGYEHTVATKSNGTLWAWGYNGHGQLGDGTTTNRSFPVQIGTAADWVSVSCGGGYTHAIKNDGTLWAWGRNDFGQLGIGDTTDRHSPVQIGTATDWVSVEGGSCHTHAIKSNATLWAWGRNDFGQIGDGTTTRRTSPVHIGTAATWGSVCSGGHYSLAIKHDGTLWAWGHNVAGQLGVGDTTDRHSPVQIGTAANWAAVSCGSYHTQAINSEGTLWAWGYNGFGQLGIGDTATYRPSPVQVGTGTNWTLSVCGDFFTVALIDTVVVHAGPDQLITLGYGSQSATLTATASGGTAPYSYLWSTSVTTASITVSPMVPTTYTVTVTDAGSQTWTDEVFVDVLDVRCGTNLDLVLYCENGVTKCETEKKATRAIARGATLGPCTWNQPPIAIANATPTSGTAPCSVSFNSSGSYDPDGTITGYHWYFGDYNSSTLANPTHPYQYPGTFTAVLTVTDDDGATGTDTVIITLTSGSSGSIYIATQNVTRVTLPGGKIAADDVVVVRDNNGQLKNGAVVTAEYTGPTSGTVSGITGSNGAVTLRSSWDRNPSGTWCFTVTDVQLSGYTFNPIPSVLTACEPSPKAAAASSAFSLSQNYPNPFNPSTTIRFDLPRPMTVSLIVTDVLGREVARPLDQAVRQSGSNSIPFDGNSIPSGVYFFRLETPDRVFVRKMVLMN